MQWMLENLHYLRLKTRQRKKSKIIQGKFYRWLVARQGEKSLVDDEIFEAWQEYEDHLLEEGNKNVLEESGEPEFNYYWRQDRVGYLAPEYDTFSSPGFF